MNDIPPRSSAACIQSQIIQIGEVKLAWEYKSFLILGVPA